MNAIKEHILQYLRGEIADDEWVALEQWLAQSAENRALFAEITDAERVRASLETMSMMDEERVWERLQGRSRTARRWWYGWVAAAAAVMALAVGAWLLGGRSGRAHPVVSRLEDRYKNDVGPGKNGAVLTLAGGQRVVLDSSGGGMISRQGTSRVINDHGQLRYDAAGGKSDAILYNTLTTGRGNHYQLVLPDGSKVWLNAASSITYPAEFAKGERRVSVTGEAYFEIAKDAHAAFVVQHGGMSVQVLGTDFNINSYDDEDAIRTTLLTGSVKIVEGASGRVIRPGQQGIVARGAIAVDDHVDLEAVMAWKNEVFKFNEATIDAVMRQMARWYDVDVTYQSAITQHFVADIPRNVPLSEVLKLLEMTDQVHFTIEGRRIIVTK